MGLTSARAWQPSWPTSWWLQGLIQLMARTMRDAQGVGLAAPQVGVDIRLAVIEDREEPQRAIAPDLLTRTCRCGS